MLRLANIGADRMPPFRGGRGLCPNCGGPVHAKCGQIKVHHWAHESKGDCDSWSEGIGPWHLSWQALVRREFVEVAMGEHRADIQGNGATVIELQHSPIGPAAIAAREHFYGNMIWVFDAEARLAGVQSGQRVFFRLGRTKPLRRCTKPVFLDCGPFLVEVEALTDVLSPFTGFGVMRSLEWFVTEYLSQVRIPRPLRSHTNGHSGLPWDGPPTWQTTSHASQWLVSGVGQTVAIAKGTPYIPLSHGKVSVWNQVRPAWAEVTDKLPQIANGWTVAELQDMRDFLKATPMILGGVLRLMPAPASEFAVQRPVNDVVQLLERATKHIGAGRLPLLKEETRRMLIERAESGCAASRAASAAG